MVPFFFSPYWYHFSTSICSFLVSVSRFGNAYSISNFLIDCICYGDMCSVIFDVIIVIVFQHHKLCLCKDIVNLSDKCVCSNCSTNRPFPWSISTLPLLLSYSLRHNDIDIRPINKPTVASKFSSERKSLMSLILSKK